jgi:dihydroxy-acid dehydratase
LLIGGCYKTMPAQLMGAASANLPTIQLVTGPMMSGRQRGQRLGACADCRTSWGKDRAGAIDKNKSGSVAKLDDGPVQPKVAGNGLSGSVGDDRIQG